MVDSKFFAQHSRPSIVIPSAARGIHLELSKPTCLLSQPARTANVHWILRKLRMTEVERNALPVELRLIAENGW